MLPAVHVSGTLPHVCVLLADDNCINRGGDAARSCRLLWFGQHTYMGHGSHGSQQLLPSSWCVSSDGNDHCIVSSASYCL